MKNTKNLFNDLLSLLYPNLCLACETNTPLRNDIICLSCKHYLPKTNFHLEQENELTERFWGRVPIETGAALYYFTKNGRTQALIHKLKYQNRKKIGTNLGFNYGLELSQSPHFKHIDLIIPVPLHPKKQHRRGYNQSDLFAQGLSEGMKVPWNKTILRRGKMTSSQTNKSRIERVKNVEDAFFVKNEALLKGKHILLVDDVITTGATLEVCSRILLSYEDVKLSLATIAIATL